METAKNILTALPQALPQVLVDQVGQGPRVFSYTLPLPTSVKLAQLLQGQGKSDSPQFFWQSADGSDALVGRGAVVDFLGDETRFDSLADQRRILANQLFHASQDPLEGQGPVLCGGFPFDDQQQEEPQWGDLGKGYFFLPQVLVRQAQAGAILTLTLSGTDMGELSQGWRELVAFTTDCFQGLDQEVATSPDQTIKVTAYQEAEWADSVADTVQLLKSSDTLTKVVLARQLQLVSDRAFDPLDIIGNLQDQQPNTYIYYLEKAGTAFVGATPERLLSATSQEFATAAVAGSTPRGATAEEDQRLGAELLADPKNQGEHGIVVQRLLKELAPLSAKVTYPEKVGLLKNRDIQHLYLPLTVPRRADSSFLKALGLLHPTPALGGEPKPAALAWIRQVEPVGRGLYGGPIGWLDVAQDTGEFAVAIRSGVFNQASGLLYAGCGVVADSIPALEVAETAVKFKPMLRGVGIK